MTRAWFKKFALPALLLFLGAWGGWAILSDNQPTFADSLIPDSQTLQDTLLGNYGLGNYVEQLRYRPPLSHAPSALLFLINGAPDLTLARLGVFFQYLLMVWVAFSIGAAAAGMVPGLMAALLLGTSPIIYGWGRLAYMDAPLALMVLVCLRVLMNNTLSSKRDGILLGLAAAGGMLTKVAFPIFAVGPLLWLLALRVRSVRAVGNLGLAVATCLLVISWWLIPNFNAILTNASMSSTGSSSGADRMGMMAATFKVFVLDVPGGLLLFGAALASSAAAWVLKPQAGPGRPFVGLGVLTLLISLGLMLLFQPLTRYVVPVYAVAAVLCGTCLGGVVPDRAGRAGGPLLAGLAGVCLLLFMLLNLAVIRPHIPKDNIVASASPRISSAGMLAPDQRDYNALQAARDVVEKFGFTKCLVVSTGPWLSERSQYHMDMLNSREKANIFHTQVSNLSREKPACVLLLAGKEEEVSWEEFTPQNERGFFNLCRTHAWFKAVVPALNDLPWCLDIEDKEATCEMGSWNDAPLDQRFFVVRVNPDKLPETLPEDPICKLDQVAWEEVIQPESAKTHPGKARADSHPGPHPEGEPGEPKAGEEPGAHDEEEEEPASPPEPGAEPGHAEGAPPPNEGPDPDLEEEEHPPPKEGPDPDLEEEKQQPPAQGKDPDLEEGDKQPRGKDPDPKEGDKQPRGKDPDPKEERPDRPPKGTR